MTSTANVHVMAYQKLLFHESDKVFQQLSEKTEKSPGSKKKLENPLSQKDCLGLLS